MFLIGLASELLHTTFCIANTLQASFVLDGPNLAVIIFPFTSTRFGVRSNLLNLLHDKCSLLNSFVTFVTCLILYT